MTTGTTDPELLAAIADWTAAFRARDIDRMMAHYGDDIVFFDLKPPFQTCGKAAMRRIWENCLPFFPERFDIEHRDERILVDGDLAVAHRLFTVVGWPEGHPGAGMWMRATIVFRRRDGRWMDVHEHVSVPFDPMTGMVVTDPGAQSSRCEQMG